MPNKSLNQHEVEQLKEMALIGTAPQDIASFFGIGIASVHNWKNKLKEQGIELPNVRGQRAKGYINGVDYPTQFVSKDAPERIINEPDGSYRFVVNGRPVVITGPVKKILITEEGLSVTY